MHALIFCGQKSRFSCRGVACSLLTRPFGCIIIASSTGKEGLHLNTDLLKLQNGSDVRGTALGENAGLTPQAVNRIACAFARWTAAKVKKPVENLRIGVGHDSRVTAEELKAAALSGIASAGAVGFDCSLASTPAMFMGTVYPESAFDGSVMLTASHLPMDRNGMKFFTREGGLDKPDIRSLLTSAADILPGEGVKEAEKFDLMALYCKDLREKIRAGVAGDDSPLPLKGLRIAVDCGNGAGGFFVKDVLIPLGADTAGSRYLEPDGTFPNHIPNPENKEAMAAASEAVIRSSADLGLIFDTDVDRMSAVLPDGCEVNRDAMIALTAAMIADDHPGGTVVTDSVTSDHLTDFLENNLNLRHHRFKRGYKNVINEAIRLNSIGISSPMAMETSGHGALIENYFLDDGAYLAVKLVTAAANEKRAGRELSRLIEGLVPAFEAREYRIPITCDNFAEYGEKVLSAFRRGAEEAGLEIASPSYEGVRVTGERGWMLLRLSLHDPLLPLNIEGNKEGDCDFLRELAEKLLSGFDMLDLSVFK